MTVKKLFISARQEIGLKMPKDVTDKLDKIRIKIFGNDNGSITEIYRV